MRKPSTWNTVRYHLRELGRIALRVVSDIKFAVQDWVEGDVVGHEKAYEKPALSPAQIAPPVIAPMVTIRDGDGYAQIHASCPKVAADIIARDPAFFARRVTQ